MNAYEAYKLYLALKRHFETESYDFIKYQGNIKASVASYQKRKDQFQFNKLCKFDDPQGFLIANFVAGNSKIWLGDLLTNKQYHDTFLQWMKRKQSLSYTFKKDLELLEGGFLSNIRVKDGQHPPLLRLYANGKVCIETMIIINDITGCFSHWNESIHDPVYWPSVYMLCSKYRPFLEFNSEKFKKSFIDAFRNH